MACRARLPDARLLAALAALLGVKADTGILEAIAGNARSVYSLARRGLGCREAVVRAAAQLLYDTSTLKPAGPASPALAALYAHVALRMNNLAAPTGLLAGLAGEACRGAADPWRVHDEILREARDERLPGRGNAERAARAAAEALVREGLQALLEALQSCR